MDIAICRGGKAKRVEFPTVADIFHGELSYTAFSFEEDIEHHLVL